MAALQSELSREACASHPCWGKVDGILVINMDDNPGRLENFMQQVGRLLPPQKLHRISAVAGRRVAGYGELPWFTERTGARAPFWGGTAGCALSHRRAVERARQEGWKNVLILEDDARLTPSRAALDMLESVLTSLRGDYFLYLGFNRPTPYGTCLKRGADGVSLWRTEGVLATHAYLLPASMYERVLALLPEEESVWEWLSRYRAVDVLYRDFVAPLKGVSVYALMPLMFSQSDEASDISAPGVTGGGYACTAWPHSYATPGGWWHLLLHPFRRIKVRLNSLRTRRRAALGGLPGYRKHRK